MSSTSSIPLLSGHYTNMVGLGPYNNHLRVTFCEKLCNYRIVISHFCADRVVEIIKCGACFVCSHKLCVGARAHYRKMRAVLAKVRAVLAYLFCMGMTSIYQYTADLYYVQIILHFPLQLYIRRILTQSKPEVLKDAIKVD